MTPHCSGLPINSIPPVDPLDQDITHRKKVYQSIVGWINWLVTCTHPDIATALKFIDSYSNTPHQQN